MEVAELALDILVSWGQWINTQGILKTAGEKFVRKQAGESSEKAVIE